jgi:L-ascorbate metabolism protein UlaG (beta-lactamase superfamily)
MGEADGNKMKTVSWVTALFVFSATGFSQDIRFTNIIRLTNTEVALKFMAPAGGYYRIDSSTNLGAATNDRWNSMLTLLSAGLNQQTDAAAPFSGSRFYRAEQLMGSNILTGDNLTTTNGDVVFHPVNHASFVMSWNGKWIYNDPVGGAGPYANWPRADLILVSHSHSDHYDATTLTALRGSNGVIIAPQALYNAMSTSLRSNTWVLAYNAATNVIGINVLAVPGYNGYHAYGMNNAYVLTVGGKRIFTSGDTGDVPEIRAVTNVDVAFFCMNLPFTTNWIGATNVIRAMRPRVLYPYHYRDSPGNTVTNPPLFKQMLGLDAGVEVRLRSWY